MYILTWLKRLFCRHKTYIFTRSGELLCLTCIDCWRRTSGIRLPNKFLEAAK